MVDFVKLSTKSEGMSGAEIALICREAGLMALTEDSNIEKPGMDHIMVKE
jgi:ATP-dependent 26S proteasome regulatory subunit